MYERIKELAEHANYLATEKEFPYDEDWFYLYNKKFAELIIRECTTTLTKLAAAYEGSEIDSDYMQGMSDSAYIIKEQFGVNE